ncbi:metal ABC transporter solute-binding protein, Zn/Mn family [Nocardia pseudobrasiliensis]|uniref:Zinc/manganese transport system substrate-binding protein n=1 Tax=Nocardia pseudobrasiliensis TaxID=45979 RepID=A0A370HS16_9NOCA|nr:zinc ABC transporter substrate-binding protein [Nocardia pseudobrasiliensis]RDI61329.1 zinc/manganese transport system substrate-binding protein [Nocardia pseudobrasiliensis]
MSGLVFGTRMMVAAVCASALFGAATACSTSSNSSDSSSGKLEVVATINAWGSIAAQLGGDKVHETSIIANPDTDPHDYEPTPADARTVAGAKVFIANGIGYDAWADKLLSADPGKDRVELSVGKQLGVPEDGNPHQWYSPDSVAKIVDAITADYKKADPADSAYFDDQRIKFVNTALAKYNGLIADIKAKYAGTPVGASESIFSPLSEALGLNLITPPAFLKAISEGTDPAPADKATIDQQIATKAIKVYVYNSQNSTPDVQAQVDAAKKQGIEVSTVTETLAPADAAFQDWQSAQLQALEDTLHKATGK